MRSSSYYDKPKNVRRALEMLRERHGLPLTATDEEIRNAELVRIDSTRGSRNEDER